LRFLRAVNGAWPPEPPRGRTEAGPADEDDVAASAVCGGFATALLDHSSS